QVRNLLPVVDCPDSVCIKAVITEPPAKRDVCVQGGAVVRDCWSRVIGEDGPFALDPRALRDVPVDEETNKLQFLREFPWYSNESCDQVRNLLPVVDCPESCDNGAASETGRLRARWCCCSRLLESGDWRRWSICVGSEGTTSC
ncbi:hypothetical protein V3C99_015855, partial [Haemonchus contortus]